ncbi:plasmid p 4b orf-3 family protein [Achaetomium macrosporum]|uniref:Plasmid p 4b orf-3 family protein n=1 Tax=Achaetomium macrosporum TaxID=79813 RepID=A0AAN7C0X4_9PEZI|nr:plasmid p 4b orf-3 family protein [Achaetomium macrosporum]
MSASNVCANASCPKGDSSTTNLLLCSRCRKARYCSQDCQAASWPSHKQDCRRQNYIIKVQLFPGKITDPEVVRTISCPAEASFWDLHVVLQLAFGWTGTHAYDFAVMDPDFRVSADPLQDLLRMTASGPPRITADMPREYELRLVDPTFPPNRRAIDRMHEWQRKHPRMVEKQADQWALWKVFDSAKYRGKQVIYMYDFGDKWEHYLTVEGRADVTDRFVCLSGTGHPVAEDVGSVNGWKELKEAYRTSRPSQEQRDRRKWYENMASNGDPEGLAGDRINFWDMERVNRHLKIIFPNVHV